MKSTLARLRLGWKLTEDGCQYVGTLDFTFAYIYDVSSRLACHFNRLCWGCWGCWGYSNKPWQLGGFHFLQEAPIYEREVGNTTYLQ